MGKAKWKVLKRKANCDGSSQDNREYNTKHAHYTNVKHNPKVNPFGIALVKMANKS